MKRLLLLASVAMAILSCNEQKNKPETIDEKFEPTDEELFAACAELKGVGQFIIGETTFKAAVNDKDYRNCTRASDRESNLYNGHWGSDFWKTNNDDVTGYFDKEQWIKKESKGKIKQLYPGFGGISIGELKFDKFDMAFLNDTLVAIYFYPERKVEDEVINHYKEKYGNGRGHYKYYNSVESVGGNLKVTTTTDEKRTWGNEKVALDYLNNRYFHMEPGKEPYGEYDYSLIIYSKNRYKVFEELLKSLSEKYDGLRQDSKSETMNTL